MHETISDLNPDGAGGLVQRTLRAAVLAAMALAAPAGAQERACPFDEEAVSFAGPPVEQARCLLRPVEKLGRLGAIPDSLPASFESLVGQPVGVDAAVLGRYLTSRGIDAIGLGGAIEEPIAARYLVIHDTGTPNFRGEPFPIDMNQETWRGNDLDRWSRDGGAHVFINRIGGSVTSAGFDQSRRVTRFENRVLRGKGKGLFVHVSLLQPRREDPQGTPRNSSIAPRPGFTDEQLDRLSLVYLTASVRSGRWLIPAFNAVLEAGMGESPDDPQRFDLQQWGSRLEALLAAVKGG